MKTQSNYIIKIEAKDVVIPLEIKNKNKYNATLDNSLESMYMKNNFKNEFYKEYGKNYSDAIVSVKFTYATDNMKTSELREYIYKNGFDLIINGKKEHYVRYKRTSSQSRIGCCLFIKEYMYDKMMEYSLAGLSVENKQIDLASFESYISLTLSSIIGTLNINKNEILLVPDIESTFTDKVINSIEKDGKLETKEDTIETTNTITDGMGLLDESKFTGLLKGKSMALLRNKLFKANCLNSKIQMFLKEYFGKEYNTAYVNDMFNNSVKVSNIKLICTPSALKFLKFGSYKQWLDSIDSTFGIVKTDQSQKLFQENLVKLNYQIINTLDLGQEQIDELLKPSFDYLYMLKNNISVLRNHISLRETDSLREASNTNEFILNMMNITDDIAKTKMFTKFRSDVTRSFTKSLKQCNIPVTGTYAHIFGNVFELLTSVVGPYKQIMYGNTVFTPFFKFNEEISTFRSPHITMGSCNKTTNVYHYELEKYFNISKDIIIVNAIDNNVMQKLSGCDYDGDECLVTNNKVVLAGIKNNFLVSTNSTSSIKINEEYNLTNLASLDVRTSKNYIGEICNLAQHLTSLYWDKKRNNEQVDDIYLDMCKINSLSMIEIDRAKRQSIIDSQKELRKIRNKYKISKQRPYYFKMFTNCYTYKFYNCPTDILLKTIENKNIRSKRTQFIKFADLFKTDNISLQDINKVNIIIDIIENNTNQIKKIYANNEYSKQQKYTLSHEHNKATINKLSNIYINESIIKYLINLYDNETDKRIKNIGRKLLIILYHSNTIIFNNLFKERKKPIKRLVEDNNGTITIYNKKYNIE